MKNLFKDIKQYKKSIRYWSMEMLAFILLPLIIHGTVIGMSATSEYMKFYLQPDWLVISIIIYGDVARKMIISEKDGKEFVQKVNYYVATSIILITISSCILGFVYLREYIVIKTDNGFQLLMQSILFSGALILSFVSNLELEAKKNKNTNGKENNYND